MSLPNILTLLRIIAIPLICALLLMQGETVRLLAFSLFILAAVTDYLDGYLARKLDLISPLGRMLDPIADKLLVGALLVALAYGGSFDSFTIWGALMIMMREIAVSGLREFLGPQNIIINASFIAKTKTTVQLIALAGLIILPIMPALSFVTWGAFWLATALTLWSGFEYFAGAWPHLKETQK